MENKITLKPALLLVTLSLLASSCTTRSTKDKLGDLIIDKIETTQIQSDLPLYRSIDQKKLSVNRTVLLGGLSDLVFSPSETAGDLEVYYTLTDRGPNGSSEDRDKDGYNERTFLVPEFTPQLLKLSRSVSRNEVKVVDRILLSHPKGRAASGLPNADPRRAKGLADEIPIQAAGSPLGFDPWGLDPEALALDERGFFWIGEEYGPSLLKVDRRGRIQKRFLPIDSRISDLDLRGGERILPEILSHRAENRGIEAMTITKEGNLLLFLQSPPKGMSKEWIPVVEFDPVAESAVGLSFYPTDPKGGKIGGATTLKNGRILVLEQNGKTGADAAQFLFEISPESAQNAISENLIQNGKIVLPEHISPLLKKLYINIQNSEVASLEKLEGLAANAQDQILIINDNDFQPEVKGRFETQSHMIFIIPRPR